MATPVGEYKPQVALVTGAAQGIGRSIAVRLAQDGYDVAINDWGQQQIPKLDELAAEIKALGRKVAVVVADVTDDSSVKNMVKMAVDELGGLDIAIANAGVGLIAPVLDMTVEQFDRVINVNLRGVFLTYKYTGLQMVKQNRGGRILGASSALGKKGNEAVSAYSSSKFAIRGLTQCFSQEMAPHNITVNAYCPGVIHTSMTASSSDAQFGGGHGAALKHLLGFGNGPSAGPEVVASIVSYLVKPEAYFISGQSIAVAGGAFTMD